MSRPNDPVMLIHGAWAGAWVWDRLVVRLTAAGLACDALDLPGNGVDGLAPATVTFESYLRFLADAVDRIGAPVSLVAHSGGGNVATSFAARWPALVSRIVYVAGMMLPDGMSFVDIAARVPGSEGVSPHVVGSADGRVTQVPIDAAVTYFFNDCPEHEARVAAGRLTPQGEGGRAVVMRAPGDTIRRMRRLYVEATQDRSVVPGAQRLMQRLTPGAEMVSLPTGHVPQFSAPDLLAGAVIPFLIG